MVKSKWFATLGGNLDDLIERIKTNLTSSVQQMSDRYAETLPDIESNVDELEKRVKQHLKDMGF